MKVLVFITETMDGERRYAFRSERTPRSFCGCANTIPQLVGRLIHEMNQLFLEIKDPETPQIDFAYGPGPVLCIQPWTVPAFRHPLMPNERIAFWRAFAECYARSA